MLLAATTVILLPFTTTLSGRIGAVGADSGAPAAEPAPGPLPPSGRSPRTAADAPVATPLPPASSTPSAAPASVATPPTAPAALEPPPVASARSDPAAAPEPVGASPGSATPPAAEPPRTSAPARPDTSTAAEPVATQPATAPSAPAATPPPGPAPRSAAYTIQVKAVPVRSEADALAGTLTGKGFNAYVQPVRTAAQPMFRVRVGPFRDRADAEASAARLVAEEGLETWIITLPPGGR
ncbi:MAG: SPOR domain-containing protein [Vicinamibacterales bacterium]